MITSDQLLRMKNERVFFLHCPLCRPEYAARDRPLDVIVQCSFTRTSALDRNFFRGGERQRGGFNTFGDPALRARFGEAVGLWTSSRGLAALTDNLHRNVAGPFTYAELQRRMQQLSEERRRRNFFAFLLAKKSEAEVAEIARAAFV